MTDAEIMKGLACCGKPNSCVDCNFGKLKGEDCIMVLANNAIELINRQKTALAKSNGQVERLKKYDEERDIRLHARLIETAKVEAIKAFVDRLKEEVTFFEDECGNFVPFVDCRVISKLANEKALAEVIA